MMARTLRSSERKIEIARDVAGQRGPGRRRG